MGVQGFGDLSRSPNQSGQLGQPSQPCPVSCTPHPPTQQGTYIRSLAHDLGRALGSHAHLVALRREASGDYRVSDAWQMSDLVAEINGRREAHRAAVEAAAAAAAEAAAKAAAETAAETVTEAVAEAEAEAEAGTSAGVEGAVEGRKEVAAQEA